MKVNEPIGWGEYGYIDLGECNPDTLRDGDKIKYFIEQLIIHIGMKQYGDVLIERFALHDPKVAGYSAFCFLETSSVTAHFAEGTDSIYIDIFTCSKLDIESAVDFSAKYFDATYERHGKTTRMIPYKGNATKLKSI